MLHGKTEARELLSGLEANIQKYYKALIVVFVALFTAMSLSDWGITANGPDGIHQNVVDTRIYCGIETQKGPQVKRRGFVYHLLGRLVFL